MKRAGDFLAKFNKLTPPNDALRSAVVKAVSSIVGATITKSAIRIHNGTAFIECSSVLKNKIRIDRRAILDDIHERIPKARESVRDIR